MTVAETILSWALWFAFLVLGLSFLLTVWRVIKGPTLADRVVALDMLVGIVIGFIALIAIRTGFTLYIDIAISLGLVGFLATVAFARFILARGREGAPPEGAGRMLMAAPAAHRRKPGEKRRSGAGPAVRRKARK
ncbi:cation:proton antiporter [Rhizobium puerariae]|uniref:Cation:proton antiporter n=1 Tax=Rhizobium puerariae TaxID=1585791 RepID=A0ABV6AL91_9HYPH